MSFYWGLASSLFGVCLETRTFVAMFGLHPKLLDLLVETYLLEEYLSSIEILAFLFWMKTYVTMDVMSVVWKIDRYRAIEIVWKGAHFFDMVLDEVS
jgi:hypothetical protein